MIAVILRILNDSFPAGNYLIDDMNPYNSYNICIKCYQNNDCNTTIQGLSGQMTCQITYVTESVTYVIQTMLFLGISLQQKNNETK